MDGAKWKGCGREMYGNRRQQDMEGDEQRLDKSADMRRSLMEGGNGCNKGVVNISGVASDGQGRAEK